MQRLLTSLFVMLLGAPFLGAVADAKPNVVLKLSGVLVQHNSSGAERLTPIEQVEPKPGDLVRYVIVASNGGSDPAHNLIPRGMIPAGTAFLAGSATSKEPARVEYSLDGGKTWSASPTIKVHTPQGDVVKKADPSTYTAVRWIDQRALIPKASATFMYMVRVK